MKILLNNHKNYIIFNYFNNYNMRINNKKFFLMKKSLFKQKY